MRANIELAVVDFGHAIGMLVRRARVAAASDELSWNETAVLRCLARDGAATTAELARAQGMRPQSMRAIISSLEQMGMLERRPHATDGRQVNLWVTAKGAAVQKRAGEAKRTWMAQAIGQLGRAEQETLFAAGKIMKRLAEADQDKRVSAF